MLTYEEFVRRYLNQRNHDTGMYWREEEVAHVTTTPVGLVQKHTQRAQREHVEDLVKAGAVPPGFFSLSDIHDKLDFIIETLLKKKEE